MTRLNKDALAIARRHGVTACTDVTGFGLCGHLRNLLRGSNLDATVRLDTLPLLPGAIAHAKDGLIPGGSRANRTFLEPMLRLHVASDDLRVALACDAQTSGGLLLCVPAARAAACVDELRAADHPASLIGELRACAGSPTITLDG
jgi:selenide,water dikinase